MMVPASRLIQWTAVAMLPLALMVSVAPSVGVLSWLPAAVLLGLAAVDARRGRISHRGVHVTLPTTVRLFVGRGGSIEIKVVREGGGASDLCLGVAWPELIDVHPGVLRVALAEGEERVRVEWRCKGVRRGRHRVKRCHVESVSPWGFWRMRSMQEQACELRLYPDVLGERQRVSSLFLRRPSLGLHRHRLVGKGREFEKLRDYVPGDSYEDIHWKATARRGRPVTKLFQVERTQEVYVLLDMSRLSGRAAGDTTVLERYVTAGLVLALAAQRGGDRFGLLTFGDRVWGYRRASNGAGHFNSCRDLMLEVEQQDTTPDFEELFATVRVRLRHRALLVVLTALDDPVLAETFERGVDLVRRQHLVLVQQLRPPGLIPLFAGENPASVDQIYERLAGHLRWHELRELQVRLHRRGVQLAFPEQERLCAEVVRRYLAVKERQAL